jgi:stage IV sporulation protein A
MVDSKILSDLTAVFGRVKIGVLGANEEISDEFIQKLDVQLPENSGVTCKKLSANEEASVDLVALIGDLTVVICVADEGENAPLSQSQQQLVDKCVSLNKPYLIINGQKFDDKSADKILRQILLQSPVKSIDVKIAEWVRVLPAESSAVAELLERLREASKSVTTIGSLNALDNMLADSKYWNSNINVNVDFNSATAAVEAFIKEGVLFQMLTEISGENIDDETALMSFVASSSQAKHSFDKVKDALECARVTGYGIVQPSDDDLNLDKPQVIKQGGNVGIRLKATAPSYHIVKVDVNGEVNPIMGSATQSENMVNSIMTGFDEDPDGMWDTNLFGKSLKGMVKEGLYGKVTAMQEDTRNKMRKTITRIVNEGKGGVICILL